MREFKSAAAAALALGLMLTIAGNAAENPSPAKPPGVEPSALPSAETQDEDFLRTAHGLLFPEIDASKLGAEKAKDPQLKALSQRMVESYTKLGRELEAAGRSTGIDVSNKQDPHAVNRIKRLQDTGPQFDLAFSGSSWVGTRSWSRFTPWKNVPVKTRI